MKKQEKAKAAAKAQDLETSDTSSLTDEEVCGFAE